jgi:hypothetical protein
MIDLRISRPAILPAFLVACLWASLKYAGTVTTALLTCKIGHERPYKDLESHSFDLGDGALGLRKS